MTRLYYLQIDDAQLGPLPREELLAHGLRRTTFVWYPGAAGWAKAEDMPELVDLFPPPLPIEASRQAVRSEPAAEAPAPRELAPLPVPAEPAIDNQSPIGWRVPYFNPYARSNIEAVHKAARIVWRLAVIALFLAGFGFLIAGYIDNRAYGSRFDPVRQQIDWGRNSDWRLIFDFTIAGSCLTLGLGGVLLFTGYILYMVLLYRSWRVLQDGFASATPGAAVGFTFVPFFNFYWVYIAFHGLTKNLNAFAIRHRLPLKPVPTASGFAVSLYHCLAMIPYLGFPIIVAYLFALPRFFAKIAPAVAELCEDDRVAQVAQGELHQPAWGELSRVNSMTGGGLTAVILAPVTALFLGAGIFGTYLFLLERGRALHNLGVRNEAIAALMPRGQEPQIQQRVRMWQSEASMYERMVHEQTIGITVMLFFLLVGIGLVVLMWFLNRTPRPAEVQGSSP